ncbi:hypothetical protein ERJ75_001195100 [Trypanosoma vivax]|uniref:Uncharacterized protein n=1 Tax=Trypanosoma vivax (strain Y486) TaxID=1055687 RepID=G0UBT1_TRYVY|nr:hypothetical protein ERJ75_001195100 [Trypanosoma vivax]CCC53279.1 conserved hypothetical protein [Trypanosoma vivax Y486]
MIRFKRCPFFLCGRSLVLRPEATKDPHRYPLGYVPLDGSESIDSVWTLVRSGFFVAPLNKVEVIHKVHTGIRHIAISEYPPACCFDIIALNIKLKEICSRLLIRRDFWALDDFNDPEMNTSFGVQNVYFDNFKWSQVLWKRFQIFVEEYFPVAEHTHLTYDEYIQLMRSFSHFEQGYSLFPLLPRKYKIHPPFGVPTLSKVDMEPLLLYSKWLQNFRGPLMLNKALIVRGRCGECAMVTRHCGVPIVRSVDPNYRAVASARKDTELMGKHFNTISFRVGEMFLPLDTRMDSSRKKSDLIVYYPDQGVYETYFTNYSGGYASCMEGFAGMLEQFFEEAVHHLSDFGVVVICCTNIYSLLKPYEPNPIEYEIKFNRRWVVLDYYDLPIRSKGVLSHIPAQHRFKLPHSLMGSLRSELWILHKIEAIGHFAYIHNIPGSKPPSCAAMHWKNKNISKLRRMVMKNQIDDLGGDWEAYKERFMHLLREQNGDDEDDMAQSIRMAMDPSYPQELANRARIAVETNIEAKRAFHVDVSSRFGEVSPRECFDSKYTSNFIKSISKNP